MTSTNTLKTVALMALLTALFMFVGYLIGRGTGMVMALIFVGILNFGAYWFSDRIALAMNGAREISPAQAPELYRIVDRVVQQARVPMPKVYLIDSPSPNAFATGRDPNHAAIAATTGIMQILTEEELEGVVAHELGHVRNRDTLISTIVATLAGAISQLHWLFLFTGMGGRDDDNNGGAMAGGLFALILAPIMAMFIQLAISRSREYGADETGAQVTGKPLALASALRKLQRGAQVRPLDVNPSTAHLFIVNPLGGRNLGNLFSTHPPLEKRIERLEKMAYEMSGGHRW